MLPIREILVPLDGSSAAEVALVEARAVARSVDARLHLVRVASSSDSDAADDPVRWRLRKREAEADLRETGRRLRDEGIETEEAVLAGRPADEIVAYARREGVDLVALTRSGEGECRGAPTGGTAHKILYRIGTSVLLSEPRSRRDPARDDGYRRLLVPVDGSPVSEWALHAAASLLPDSGGELVVACAVPPEGERAVAGPRRDAETFIARARRRVVRPGLRVDAEVVPTEHPAKRLHSLAEERDVDMVVLSAHGRSGSAPWPYGGLAINLLMHGRRPTLVLQDQPEPGRAEPPERQRSLRPSRSRPRESESGDSGSRGESTTDPEPGP